MITGDGGVVDFTGSVLVPTVADGPGPLSYVASALSDLSGWATDPRNADRRPDRFVIRALPGADGLRVMLSHGVGIGNAYDEPFLGEGNEANHWHRLDGMPVLDCVLRFGLRLTGDRDLGDAAYGDCLIHVTGPSSFLGLRGMLLDARRSHVPVDCPEEWLGDDPSACWRAFADSMVRSCCGLVSVPDGAGAILLGALARLAASGLVPAVSGQYQFWTGEGDVLRGLAVSLSAGRSDDATLGVVASVVAHYGIEVAEEESQLYWRHADWYGIPDGCTGLADVVASSFDAAIRSWLPSLPAVDDGDGGASTPTAGDWVAVRSFQEESLRVLMSLVRWGQDSLSAGLVMPQAADVRSARENVERERIPLGLGPDTAAATIARLKLAKAEEGLMVGHALMDAGVALLTVVPRIAGYATRIARTSGCMDGGRGHGDSAPDGSGFGQLPVEMLIEDWADMVLDDQKCIMAMHGMRDALTLMPTHDVDNPPDLVTRVTCLPLPDAFLREMDPRPAWREAAHAATHGA